MNTTAAIYGRQSKDKKVSIDQQLSEGQRVCAEQGWTVYGLYSDGSSASRFATKAREDWSRLLGDLDAGQFGVLVLWESSRGDRSLASWVILLDTCRDKGVRIYVISHQRLYDMAINHDWETLVNDGVKSASESNSTSDRVKRNVAAKAAEGKPHGKIAFGWDRVKGEDVLNSAQAEIIADVAKRLLAGESLRSIVRDLNNRGITTGTGKPWKSTTLRGLMLRERNAGLRQYRGKVVGKGTWEPIYDLETHTKISELLTAPDRLTHKGTARKYLGTGIYLCGRCGGVMRHNSQYTHPKTGKITAAKYQCSDCAKIARKASEVDELVNAAMVAWFKDANAFQEAPGATDTVREIRKAKAELEARLATAAELFNDGSITADQYRINTSKLTPQIDALQRQIAQAGESDVLVQFLDVDDITTTWNNAPLDVRRAAVQNVLTVTIMPTVSGAGGYGRTFDSESVRIERKRLDLAKGLAEGWVRKRVTQIT